MTAHIVRKILSLEEGKTVTIKGSEWVEFVDEAERLHPGRREWRCLFAHGWISITDLTCHNKLCKNTLDTTTD